MPGDSNTRSDNGIEHRIVNNIHRRAAGSREKRALHRQLQSLFYVVRQCADQRLRKNHSGAKPARQRRAARLKLLYRFVKAQR